MSFCPTKDIHSVYLDNEMPEIYKAEYEAHISSCSECKKELEKLKAVRSLLQHDSESLTIDNKFMDDSFARLQMKMAYKKNVEKAGKPKRGYYGYAVAGIAAAAAFAFVVPLNFNKASGVNNLDQINSNILSIPNATNANNVSFNSGRRGLVSSNIQGTVISSNRDENIQSAIVQNVKDADVLRPDFRDESISIRITVPGMGSSPVVTEISLPAEVVSGRF